jgi:acetolactate synthase-1/2/3 large subunit
MNNIKVSDYIVEFFNKNGIDTLFTITGGFAMHLNDSFGKHPNYNIYYQHHEQACGYSGVGYSKTNSKPCIVCTTSGCAATNAISPCLVAHQDSLPILFISGQGKSNETIKNMNQNENNMKLRHYAGADCDIISIVKPITKYAHEIDKVEGIEEILTEAYKQLINGRPGPVWLSVCVDIQGFLMDKKDIPIIQKDMLSQTPKLDDLYLINQMLLNANRPIIIAGNGIKLGSCQEKFKQFLNKYKIPVVATFHGLDILESMNELYIGKIGLIGDRAGNFALQNSDLVLSFGCRMAQAIIGYRADWFAREAKIIYIDNDENELLKENTHYDLKVNMDLNLFFDNYNYTNRPYNTWVEKCNHWKKKWQFETPETDNQSIINPYHFLKTFFKLAPSNKVITCSSGSILNIIWHMNNVKEGDKFIISSQGDMGFEIPASIGSQIAYSDKTIYPILGDGSFQLNIQELQTIIQYKLPIKILLFNNGGYGAITVTQETFFGNKFGVDKSSGLSIPDTEKIATAYGIKYINVQNIETVNNNLEEFINYTDGPVICEVFCCIQGRVPRLKAKRNDDGTFTNRPFEDMDPFLDRDEFKQEMIVKIV